MRCPAGRWTWRQSPARIGRDIHAPMLWRVRLAFGEAVLEMSCKPVYGNWILRILQRKRRITAYCTQLPIKSFLFCKLKKLIYLYETANYYKNYRILLYNIDQDYQLFFFRWNCVIKPKHSFVGTISWIERIKWATQLSPFSVYRLQCYYQPQPCLDNWCGE